MRDVKKELQQSQAKKPPPLKRQDTLPEIKRVWLEELPSRCEEVLLHLNNPSDIDDVLFDILAKGEDRVSADIFWEAIECTGIQRTDPRLEETRQCFAEEMRKAGRNPDDHLPNFMVDRPAFHRCINENIFMIGEIFKNDLVISNFASFCRKLEAIYLKCKSNTNGKPSSLTPQMSRVDPNLYGVSLCTIDGQMKSFGDAEERFTVQALCKPFNYAIAASDIRGPGYVHELVGQEPSGRGSNSLSLDHHGKPHNPMITSGGVVTASLIKSSKMMADRFDFIAHRYSKLAGYTYTGFDNSCYLSMRENSDRDFALSHYMRENQCFPENSTIPLQKTVEFMFQLKSIEVTTQSMSIMAATLANGGICPITGERLLSGEAVRDTLSLMYSCGLYDYSGKFAFKVGLPAKSGCSGGVILVIPNVMGVCIWSPNVDENNNSYRGVQFCEELVEKFNFHNYDNLKHTSQKMDPRRPAPDTSDNPIVNLLFGAAKGDVTAIRRYLLLGMDMSTADYDGRTALHLAAAEGQLKVVKLLIEQCGVPYNPKDRYNFTPLDDARKFQHRDVSAYLEQVAKEKTPKAVPAEVPRVTKTATEEAPKVTKAV